MPKSIINLLNKKYGKLLVLELFGRNDRNDVLWKCICDCGKTVIVSRGSLQSGNTKSCGCLRKESLIKYYQDKERVKFDRSNRHQSELTKHKISLAQSGERGSNWKDGISFGKYCPKWNKNLRHRIRAFFNYECVICGKPQRENITKSGKIFKLSCHHVEYDKQACCRELPIHFAALCIKCHNKTNTEKERWQYILHYIIDTIYNGKSYYTLEEWEAKLRRELIS